MEELEQKIQILEDRVYELDYKLTALIDKLKSLL